jgi:dienelactone hydrolase
MLVAIVVTACGSDAPSNVVDSSLPPLDGTSIDGATDDAVVSSRDPAEDGDLTVTTSTEAIPGAAQGRTLPATIFTPEGTAPRPLVVISPGFQMARAQYESYARHLASWGFVAVLVDYAETGFFIDHARLAADVPAVIDWALARTGLAIDAQQIAAVGHSLGGKISVFAASLDPRIGAVVGWDPVDSTSPSVAPELVTGLTAAVAVVGETTNASGGGMPCAPAAENYTTFYNAAPSPAVSITVNGADHMDWVDDPSCFVCGFCSPGSAAPELARKVTRRVNVAWLRRQLLDDAAMDAWLDAPPELGTGVAITRK